MQVKVTKDNVSIIDSEYQVHKGEYRVNGIEYEFSEEYENLTCKAIFNDGINTIEVPITSGTSIIPYEILSSGASKCELRVYGYETEEVEGESKLKLRYSPTYTEFDIRRGSYIPDAGSTEEITPSQFEQYSEALNQGLNELENGLEKINTAVEEANNLNIEINKEDSTTTVTLTKKDGTTEETTIEDGADFEYDWQGTSLGVKTSEEQDYQYVDLKGNTGEAGYTPRRGIDYWTEQDQEQVVNEAKEEVLNQIVIPTKTSDLTNDSGFIDNSVNNLTNYYKKNELYNKTETDTKISSVYKYKGSVATYEDLPSSGLTIGDVYNVETDGSNYAWDGITWDKLGGDVDLSNYYNKTQTNTLLNGKVDNATLNDYYTKTRADELLGGKVGFTDYANESKAGVIKPNSASYGINVSSTSGTLYGSTKTYQDYQSFNSNGFISKGTLENVITGKELVNKTYVDGLVGDIETSLKKSHQKKLRQF